MMSLETESFFDLGQPDFRNKGLKTLIRNLKGGGSEDNEPEVILANKRTFRQIIETHNFARILVDNSEMCTWDIRAMCQWSRELSDQYKEYELQPMPQSNIEVGSLQGDRPAHLDGQWKMGRSRSGRFLAVRLSYFTDCPDARQLFLIYGGPWHFELCQVRCAGCQALVLERRGAVEMVGCHMGGFGEEDGLRAANGLIADHAARAVLRNVTVELTGHLDGAALKVAQAHTSRRAG